MDFLTFLSTRWDNIPETDNAFRLLCSQPTCSLSCANLKNGKLSTTSIHGTERHSYELNQAEMVFMSLMFLKSLSVQDLDIFIKFFNSISPETTIKLDSAQQKS